ncbi:MAG TPA: endonuclease V [Segeticoccus sp.]|uniref:endonuclease V n=1 Tax=Segeticoccus sp. TaxID=2706531 RepID=UPI002D802305|nr:endonuclease V [Segeticoccus sp.]HET8599393.1 endonuclease V [Segeticoccus sp.]
MPAEQRETWPRTADRLVELQHRLARLRPEAWQPPEPLRTGAAWVCFPRGETGRGRAGDPAWAAAVVMDAGRVVERALLTGAAGGPYVAGLMALRAGPLLAEVVQRLADPPDVLLLDATARDHPRAAGLALHLGWALGLPTIGVTHRPLVAAGEWPADDRGAQSPLRVGEHVVGCWLRTRPGTRPLAVHPGWRTDLPTAVDVVLAVAHRRTPEPLRGARELARRARGA